MSNLSHYEMQEMDVNHLTGEVTRHTSKSTTRRKLPPEPPFIKLYIDDVGRMEGLNKGQTTVFYCLAKMITFDGMISLTALQRRRIEKLNDISPKTFRNYLHALVDRGLLIRHTASDFEADPHYFAKGAWGDILDRREDFELRIRYRQDGSREVSTQGVEPEED